MAFWQGRRIFQRGGANAGRGDAPHLPAQVNGGPPRPLSGPLPPRRASEATISRGNFLASGYETSQKIYDMHAHGAVNSPNPETREWHSRQLIEAGQNRDMLAGKINKNAQTIKNEVRK